MSRRLEDALRAVVEAGRTSDSKRARYMAEIAQAALDGEKEDASDRREIAMEAGMLHGVEAYNDAMGFDTSGPPYCDQCGFYHFRGCERMDEEEEEDAPLELDWGELPNERCSDPRGHSWVESDETDERHRHGEGRTYCEHCGADGDA